MQQGRQSAPNGTSDRTPTLMMRALCESVPTNESPGSTRGTQPRISRPLSPSAAQLDVLRDAARRFGAPSFTLMTQREEIADYVYGAVLALGIDCSGVVIVRLGDIATRCAALPDYMAEPALLAHQAYIEERFQTLTDKLDARLGIDQSDGKYLQSLRDMNINQCIKRLTRMHEKRDGSPADPMSMLLPPLVYSGMKDIVGHCYSAVHRQHPDASSLLGLVLIMSKGAIIGGTLKNDRSLPIYTR